MKNIKMLALVVTVLALAVLACRIGSRASQPAPEAATPAPSQAEEARDVTVPTPGAPTSAPAPAEQDLSVSSLTEGLASLKSYKSDFSINFVGKDEQGQPVNARWETHEEFIQEPRAQRVTITASGSDMQSGVFEMISIGDTGYMITHDQGETPSCIATSSDTASQLQPGLFTPEMLGGISGAKFVNRETVNGIPAKHYAWKDSDGLVGLGFTSVKGEAWVAADGNYVVRYLTEATGKGSLPFGMNAQEGVVNIEYNLTEVNGSFSITPPDGCQTAATDIPIMADATDKSSFGEMMTYSSASAFADIVQFYKTEMPNNGWQPGGEPTEMEGMAMLEFTKDNRKAQVMINFDPDQQTVNVMITTSQE